LGTPTSGSQFRVTSVAGTTLSETLDAIAANAAELDAHPDFPRDAFARLQRAGVLTPAPTRAEEWALVRAVAKADGSVGRLYEGHLNAVERLEADGIDPQDHWLGVWGANPAPGEGEGEPASIENGAIRGTKVFCSGAGGLDRALVTASGRLVYVDLASNVEIDRTWYRAGGMRASESHRVTFHGATVLATLGDLVREPYFSRDAIRTAAAWAGIADAAAETALRRLDSGDDLKAHAAGRILTAQATIDRWFEHAASRDPEEDLSALSIQLRAAVADAGATILEQAARAAGSRPFATGTALDRARRDFELFVLQHRLDPLLVKLGREDSR
jgi:hypothetical protein